MITNANPTPAKLALCGAFNDCGFRVASAPGPNALPRRAAPIAKIGDEGYPICACGSEMRMILERDGGERLAAYQAAAARAGTRLMPAADGVAPRIGGGVTFHPLERGIAIGLAIELRKLGAEAKISPTPAIGYREERLFVYLSGCSFLKGDRL